MTIHELLCSALPKENPKEDVEALLKSCSNPSSWQPDSITGMALILLLSQNTHRLVSPEDYNRFLTILNGAIAKYQSMQAIHKPQYILHRTIETRRHML